MKTKKAVFFMSCLIFICFSTKVSAQTHLDALIKKCENYKSVDMEVVKNKRKTEKDLETKTVNIRISNDKNLVSEFLNAFKKDAANSEQAMFRKQKESNEISYYQCRFPKQTYTIVVKETGNANVTVGNPLKFQFRKFSADSLRQNREREKERIKQYKERIKQHKLNDLEWRNQQKERIRQYKNHIKQHKLKDLDSILIKHDIMADSLIRKSTYHFNSINWDSITSKFGKNIDSMVNKLGVGWDEVWERYRFE